jgi:hypothetical protein
MRPDNSSVDAVPTAYTDSVTPATTSVSPRWYTTYSGINANRTPSVTHPLANDDASAAR